MIFSSIRFVSLCGPLLVEQCDDRPDALFAVDRGAARSQVGDQVAAGEHALRPHLACDPLQPALHHRPSPLATASTSSLYYVAPVEDWLFNKSHCELIHGGAVPRVACTGPSSSALPGRWRASRGAIGGDDRADSGGLQLPDLRAHLGLDLALWRQQQSQLHGARRRDRRPGGGAVSRAASS
jgi:hypothetical protein